MVLYVGYRAVRYVFVTGRWEIVQVNLKLFMVGRYPSDELWRISVAIALIAMFTGLVAGFIGKPPGRHRARRAEHREAVVAHDAGDDGPPVAAASPAWPSCCR